MDKINFTHSTRLTGADVVLGDLGIEILAGEFPGIIDRLCYLAFVELAERGIGVNIAGIYRIGYIIVVCHKPYITQPIVNIPVRLIIIGVSRVGMYPLMKYLSIGKIICLFQRAVTRISISANIVDKSFTISTMYLHSFLK